jgi:hypothetical protein
LKDSWLINTASYGNKKRIKLNKSVEASDLIGVPVSTLAIAFAFPDEDISDI